MHANSIQQTAPGTRVRARVRAYVYVAFRFIFCYTILSTTRGRDRGTREEDVWYHYLKPSLLRSPRLDVRLTGCELLLSRVSLDRAFYVCVSRSYEVFSEQKLNDVVSRAVIVLSVIPRINFSASG